MPDIDDTISVGSQDGAPELLTDEPPPSANNEETMLFTVFHFPTGGAIVGSAVLQTVTNDEVVSNPGTNDLSDHTAVISTASRAVPQTATNHQIVFTSSKHLHLQNYGR